MDTSLVKIQDLVYYMKRPYNTIYRSDNDGEWLSGAGRVVSITNKSDLVIEKGAMSLSNIKSIQVVTFPDPDTDETSILSLKIGEFTYNVKNFLTNLLS